MEKHLGNHSPSFATRQDSPPLNSRDVYPPHYPHHRSNDPIASSYPDAALPELNRDQPSSVHDLAAHENDPKRIKTSSKNVSRTSRACMNCRRQKMRCEASDDPPCLRCRKNALECTFERRTDYLLNPEDMAWQKRMEERVSELSRSVESIIDLLSDHGIHFGGLSTKIIPVSEPKLPSRPTKASSPSRYALHNLKSITHVDPIGSSHSNCHFDAPSPSHGFPTSPTHQDENRPTRLNLPPLRQALPSPNICSRRASSGTSSKSITQLRLPNPESQSLLPKISDVQLLDLPESPQNTLPVDYYCPSVVEKEEAEEVYRFVQRHYRTKIPLFEFAPVLKEGKDVGASTPKIPDFRQWSRNSHLLMVDVVLCHGSLSHPTLRSPRLFVPLLNQAQSNFQRLSIPLNEILLTGMVDSTNLLDVTKKDGYQLVLTMCVATVFLSGPNSPYRFLSPSMVVQLLRLPSLRQSYDDLFRTDCRGDAIQPIDRYQVYLWLFMIFCQFTQYGLILPHDIANSPGIVNIRQMLKLPATTPTCAAVAESPGLLNKFRKLLCAHAELNGLQQWSRQKWAIEFLGEAEWTKGTEIEGNLLGGMRSWWTRFEETRSSLEGWENYWSELFVGAKQSSIGWLASCGSSSSPNEFAKMIWMHYQAKRAANFASGLFRLPSDVQTWSESTDLYQVALKGVRLSCELLQSFLSEAPDLDQDGVFPARSSGSSARIVIKSRAKRRHEGTCGEEEPQEDDATQEQTQAEIDHRTALGLATSPISIQRYPIPFSGVILKAIQLKSSSLNSLAKERSPHQRDRGQGANVVFEKLSIENSFKLLERVKLICQKAGLDASNPVSKTAMELENMITMTRQFIPSTISA